MFFLTACRLLFRMRKELISIHFKGKNEMLFHISHCLGIMEISLSGDIFSFRNTRNPNRNIGLLTSTGMKSLEKFMVLVAILSCLRFQDLTASKIEKR